MHRQPVSLLVLSEGSQTVTLGPGQCPCPPAAVQAPSSRDGDGRLPPSQHRAAQLLCRSHVCLASTGKGTQVQISLPSLPGLQAPGSECGQRPCVWWGGAAAWPLLPLPFPNRLQHPHAAQATWLSPPMLRGLRCSRPSRAQYGASGPQGGSQCPPTPCVHAQQGPAGAAWADIALPLPLGGCPVVMSGDVRAYDSPRCPPWPEFPRALPARAWWVSPLTHSHKGPSPAHPPPCLDGPHPQALGSHPGTSWVIWSLWSQVRNSKASGYCLDQGAEDDDRAILYPCHGMSSQVRSSLGALGGS